MPAWFDQYMHQWPQSEPNAAMQPFRPSYGSEGFPLIHESPFGQAVSMGMGAVLPGMMSTMGMAPMGVSDRNLYDRLISQQFTKQYNRTMSAAGKRDQAQFQNMFRGAGAALGIPWGEDQARFAGTMSKGLATIAPMAMQIAPEFMDQVTGGRSETVLAHHVMMGGKQRFDPTTGVTGLGGRYGGDLSKELYNQMFSGERWKEHGLSAGQAGSVMREFEARGMMSGTPSLKDYSEGVPEKRWSRLMKDAGMKSDAKFSEMSGAEKALLASTPEAREELKSFDAKRMSSTLKDWSKSVQAMREIFGDAGYPNAPMPALIGALNQMTSGGMSQLSPTRINAVVRTTANLARISGIGLDATLGINQQISQDLAARGIDPVLAPFLTQDVVAARGAFGQLGMGRHQVFGREDINQYTAREKQRTVGAAGSANSNLMALGVRLEEMGQIKAGTAAARWLTAIRAESTVFNPTGNAGDQRSVDLRNERETIKMLADAGDLRVQDVQLMADQRHTNRESQVNTPEINRVTRRLQTNDMKDILGDVAGHSASIFINNNLTPDQQKAMRKSVESLSSQVGAGAIEGWVDKTSLKVGADKDTTKRYRYARGGAAAAIEAAIADPKSEGHDAAVAFKAQYAGKPKEYQAALVAMTNQAMGQTDEYMVYNKEGNIQTALTEGQKNVPGRVSRIRAEATAQAMFQTSVANEAKGPALLRAARALLDSKPGDKTSVSSIITEAYGGVHGAEIAGILAKGHIGDRMRDLGAEYTELTQKLGQAENPEERKKITENQRQKGEAIKAVTREAEEAIRESGFATAERVTDSDIGRVIRKKATADVFFEKERTGNISTAFLGDKESALKDVVTKARAANPALFKDAAGNDLTDAAAQSKMLHGWTNAEVDQRVADKGDRMGIAVMRGTYAKDRNRISKDYVGDVSDTVAAVVSDEHLMPRLGTEGFAKIKELDKANTDLVKLAFRKTKGSVGNLVAKGGSDVTELTDRIAAGEKWLLERTTKTDATKDYTGIDDQDKLTAIAKKLKAAGRLKGTSFVDMLEEVGEDKELVTEFNYGNKDTGAAAVLTDEETDTLRKGMKQSESLKDKVAEYRESLATKGRDTLEVALTKLTGDKSLAQEMVASGGPGTKQALELAGGSGLAAQKWRAELEAKGEDVSKYRDLKKEGQGEITADRKAEIAAEQKTLEDRIKKLDNEAQGKLSPEKQKEIAEERAAAQLKHQALDKESKGVVSDTRKAEIAVEQKTIQDHIKELNDKAKGELLPLSPEKQKEIAEERAAAQLKHQELDKESKVAVSAKRMVMIAAEQEMIKDRIQELDDKAKGEVSPLSPEKQKEIAEESAAAQLRYQELEKESKGVTDERKVEIAAEQKTLEDRIKKLDENARSAVPEARQIKIEAERKAITASVAKLDAEAAAPMSEERAAAIAAERKSVVAQLAGLDKEVAGTAPAEGERKKSLETVRHTYATTLEHLDKESLAQPISDEPSPFLDERRASIAADRREVAAKLAATDKELTGAAPATAARAKEIETMRKSYEVNLEQLDKEAQEPVSDKRKAEIAAEKATAVAQLEKLDKEAKGELSPDRKKEIDAERKAAQLQYQELEKEAAGVVTPERKKAIAEERKTIESRWGGAEAEIFKMDTAGGTENREDIDAYLGRKAAERAEGGEKGKDGAAGAAGGDGKQAGGTMKFEAINMHVTVDGGVQGEMVPGIAGGAHSGDA